MSVWKRRCFSFKYCFCHVWVWMHSAVCFCVLQRCSSGERVSVTLSVLHYTPLYSTVCTALYSSYTPLSVLHYTPLYSTVSTALYSSYTPLSVLHYTLVILHCSTTLFVLHYKNRIERWLLEGFQLWCCMLAVWWWGNESAEQEAVWVRARKNWRG